MKDKEKWKWVSALAILFFLVCIVSNAISRKTIALNEKPQIEQGWDKTLKVKGKNILTNLRQFDLRRISISVRPMSCIYFFAFNHGVPLWLSMILAYMPLPALTAAISFSAAKSRWKKVRERKISRILTIVLFFLFTVLIIYKALRRQFDEFFFIFTIGIFIPAALGALLIEKKSRC